MPPLNSFEKSLIAVAITQSVICLPANAATITVSASCSLANAIRSANQDNAIGGCTAGEGGADIIDIPQQTITLLTPDIDGSQFGESGLPLVESDVTIQGNGSIIERSSEENTLPFRIIAIKNESSATLTMESMTLRNGYVDYGTDFGLGGAIELGLSNSLVINNLTLTGNSATGYGGAIYAFGSNSVNISNSTISNNSALGRGGAIRVNSTVNNASMQIDSSTISNNTSDAQGGAIAVYRTSSTISNSTISGNTGGAFASGLYINAAEATLINTTVTDNSNGGSTDGSRGIRSLYVSGNEDNPPAVTLQNTVIANGVGESDCASNINGFVINHQNSIIESAEPSCGFTGTQQDPMLGTLRNNGGPTLTHAPLEGSILIGDAATNICSDPPINGVDQNGLARGAESCTIGASEFVEIENNGDFFVVPLEGGRSVIFSL